MRDMKIRVDLRGLQQMQSAIDEGLSDPGAAGPIRDAFNEWGRLYRAAMQVRFALYSRGGGDWAPLKESTRLARRDPKGRTGRSRISARKRAFHKALRLLRAHVERYPGALTEKQIDVRASRTARARGGSRALKREIERQRERRFAILRDTGTLFSTLDPTLGRPGQLSRAVPYGIQVGVGGGDPHPKSKAATIGQIAAAHQFGGPNLEPREILVEPPPDVADRMRAVMARAIRRVARDASR